MPSSVYNERLWLLSDLKDYEDEKEKIKKSQASVQASPRPEKP